MTCEIKKTHGILPAQFAAGDLTFVFIMALNGWYLYRVTPTFNRFHEIRWEVFVPLGYGEIEHYPSECVFERHDNAERFDTLPEALSFLEACEKVTNEGISHG